jgi:hypothetical protein
MQMSVMSKERDGATRRYKGNGSKAGDASMRLFLRQEKIAERLRLV